MHETTRRFPTGWRNSCSGNTRNSKCWSTSPSRFLMRKPDSRGVRSYTKFSPSIAASSLRLSLRTMLQRIELWELPACCFQKRIPQCEYCTSREKGVARRSKRSGTREFNDSNWRGQLRPLQPPSNLVTKARFRLHDKLSD